MEASQVYNQYECLDVEQSEMVLSTSKTLPSRCLKEDNMIEYYGEKSTSKKCDRRKNTQNQPRTGSMVLYVAQLFHLQQTIQASLNKPPDQILSSYHIFPITCFTEL